MHIDPGIIVCLSKNKASSILKKGVFVWLTFMNEETAARSWNVRWWRGRSERIQCGHRHDPGGNGCLKVLGVERPQGKVLEFLNVTRAPVVYDAQAEDLSCAHAKLKEKKRRERKTSFVTLSCPILIRLRRSRKCRSFDSSHTFCAAWSASSGFAPRSVEPPITAPTSSSKSNF